MHSGRSLPMPNSPAAIGMASPRANACQPYQSSVAFGGGDLGDPGATAFPLSRTAAASTYFM
jgi:hypothetical protein